MNKREQIHFLVDKLLDLEESSCKGVNFSYGSSSTADSLSFYITPNRLNYRNWLTKNIVVYFNAEWARQNTLEAALEVIKETALIPDGPVEKMIDVQLTESKAKELGLIA